MRKLLLALLAIFVMPAGLLAWDRCYTANGHDRSVNSREITSIEALVWHNSLDGSMQVDGTPVDLGTETGLVSENSFGLRISHVLNDKAAIELAYLKNDHSGQINRKVTFQNRDYNAGASLRLENSWIDVAYSHSFVRASEADQPGNELFYLDGQLGAKFSNAEINVYGRSDPATVIIPVRYEESWSESFPIPYFGLSAGGQISEKLWLKAGVKYMRVNFSGNNASHADYGINAAFRLNDAVSGAEWFVDIGYRGVRYDVNSNGDKADLRYTGPVLGVFARF